MSSPVPPEELLDLRFLPAWVNEPVHPNDYANFQGEESFFKEDRGGRRPPGSPDRRRDQGRPGESRGRKPREGSSRHPQSKRPGAGPRTDKKREPHREREN